MQKSYIVISFLFIISFRHELWGQGYVGLNAGPLTGRTLEGYFAAQPKNQDWLLFGFGGGYTMKGPNFLRLAPIDNLDHVRHGGYHFFAFLRNELTEDHHAHHLFWGLKFTMSQVNEWGIDKTTSDLLEEQNRIWGMGVLVGYSIVLNRQGISKKIYFDFGIQPGFRIQESGDLLQQGMNYIGGLGYGRTGVERGFNFDLIAALRYELWHGRFGYKKPSGY